MTTLSQPVTLRQACDFAAADYMAAFKADCKESMQYIIDTINAEYKVDSQIVTFYFDDLVTKYLNN